MLPIGLILHLAFGLWFYTSRDIFTSDYESNWVLKDNYLNKF